MVYCGVLRMKRESLGPKLNRSNKYPPGVDWKLFKTWAEIKMAPKKKEDEDSEFPERKTQKFLELFFVRTWLSNGSSPMPMERFVFACLSKVSFS